MKVHIVTPDLGQDRILPRLAQMLADGTGWSISNKPWDGASLNYFMVYIDYAQNYTDWRKTKLAAYFSHYEPDVSYKKFWWETAEPLIDIKTITANQYSQLLTGEIIKVIPGIDQNLFTIQEKKQNDKPIIGVSGFVDRKTGRKGEKLLAQLAYDLDGEIEFVASGDGWPVKHINRQFEGLPTFYNSLDFYLCTSLIEGIPMPPLEALACGIPIIIPRGVGMLDEMESIPGIYRFECGNYSDLFKVTKEAIKDIGKHDREELCGSVSKFTPEAWCKSHVKGFEKAFGNNTVKTKAATGETGKESDRHGGRGVFYVAYGDPARNCAKAAIESFKGHMRDIPVALTSSERLGIEDIFIEFPDDDIGARSAKTMIYDLTPKNWQFILYLDADTEIIADISFLYQALEDGWDMVICKNPGKFHTAREMVRSDNKDECEYTFRQIGTDELIQLNGGVFAFQRNKRTKAFFKAWHEEWQRYGKRDQAALLRALFLHPLKIYVLGNQWNTITRYDPAEISAGILHYPLSARRWRGTIHHRSDDPTAWEAVREFEKMSK
ncbi:MAG: glycosyltransferase [Candidatus Omnitrophica bacterium]|nr:glycosyltransferase [Candidatus Omnitrophota bacterium]